MRLNRLQTRRLVENLVKKQLFESFFGFDDIDENIDIIAALDDNYSSPISSGEKVVGNSTITSCSKWARSAIGGTIGFNAWHGYTIGSVKLSDEVKWSAPMWITASSIFTSINKNHSSMNSYVDDCKNLMQEIYNNSGHSNTKFKDYGVGTCLGVFYPGSPNHAWAFFEGATGRINKGAGAKSGYGPYFVVKKSTSEYKEGTPWTPEMIGKDIEFKPNLNLIKQKGPFAFNTHIGIIGAKDKKENEAIMYHNISGKVKAVPITKTEKYFVLWAGKWPKNKLKIRSK